MATDDRKYQPSKDLATRQKEYEDDKALMSQLDARTKVPHLLIELRSLGFIEICGKDLGGIHGRFEEFLRTNWGCEFEQVKHDCDRLCDASFCWEAHPRGCCPCLCGVKNPTVFRDRGLQGENNMGKLTMEIINYMCNTCGWGLKLCNGNNLGLYGTIREQQIKFNAPHPLNLIAPHLMVELRQSGWIEVNGPNTNGIYEKIGRWLTDKWNAKPAVADPLYSDLKFACSSFKTRGSEGENNMGLRTMEIVDFMVKDCAWTMITCNGGNFGRCGDIREQQLIFRNDDHVQHGQDHVMVELRDVGYIEVNGLFSSRDIEPYLDKFIKESWKCQDYRSGFFENTKFCDRKYSTPNDFFFKDGLTNNIGKLTIQLSMFMASQGWMLMLTNGGATSQLNSRQTERQAERCGTEINGQTKREQQIKFTRARETDNAGAPLLMIEMRCVPRPTIPDAMRPRKHREVGPVVTKTEGLRMVNKMISEVDFEGLIEINGPNTNGIYEKLSSFFQKHMKGKCLGPKSYCDQLHSVGVLRKKRTKDPHLMAYSERYEGYYNGENNIGKYTMRICDFLVDHLGEWDLIVCDGNTMERAWSTFKGNVSFCAREQQLVFRHRPGGRAVFMSSVMQQALGHPPLQAPEYWKDVNREGHAPPEVIPASDDEKTWLQELLDNTFKKKTTRDRRGGTLATRFVVTAAVRSENGQLWDMYARRREYLGSRAGADALDSLTAPITMSACGGLAARCDFAGLTSPANEVYLMHGTNPTSAIAILGTSFKIDLAGKSAGTMFGPGAYLAEASSKADEYAADDKGGSYDGLFAMLVCRAVLGKSYVTEQPGDYREKVLSGEFGSVLGDREKAVGTFREFIFFNEDSIYPEFAVFYKRDMGKDTK